MKKFVIGVSGCLLCCLVIFLVVTYESPEPTTESSQESGLESSSQSTESWQEADPVETEKPNMGDISVGDIDYSSKDETQSQKPSSEDKSDQIIIPVEDLSWEIGGISNEMRIRLSDEACRLYALMLSEDGNDYSVTWKYPSPEEISKFDYMVSYYVDVDCNLVLNLHLDIKNNTTGKTKEEIRSLKLSHDLEGLYLVK